jgi:hypothetical protein
MLHNTDTYSAFVLEVKDPTRGQAEEQMRAVQRCNSPTQ